MVLVCVLSLCVRCCVVLRVVLLGAGLVCAVVGAPCCGVSLCVVVSPLVFCGVLVLLWCVLVSCCAGLCSVVLRRLVVPWCWAVLCVFLLLRVFLIPLKTFFRFLKIKIKKKIFFKIIRYPAHTCRQTARPFWAGCLTCRPAASTLTGIWVHLGLRLCLSL